MTDWLNTLERLASERTPSVLVTVAAVKGSTPREAGTKMVVTAHGFIGTIGGGQLEYLAIATARELLDPSAEPGTVLCELPLGASLGQCCGGFATLLFERVPRARSSWVDALARIRRQETCVVATCLESRDHSALGAKLIVSESHTYGGLSASFDAEATQRARSMLCAQTDRSAISLEQVDRGLCSTVLYETLRDCDFHVVLFGAGHVGKALVTVLSGLPCRIRWVDSREHEFPSPLPENVTVTIAGLPEYEVERAPPQCFFVVMTHSHQLDLQLCEHILERGDFRYFGLIGSRSKRKRFEKRLSRKRLAEPSLKRMVCPIGVPHINGKHPGSIAIAVAAQLVQVYEHTQSSAREVVSPVERTG